MSEVAGCNRRQHPRFVVAPRETGGTAWTLVEAVRTEHPAAVTSSRGFGSEQTARSAESGSPPPAPSIDANNEPGSSLGTEKSPTFWYS